MSPENSVLVEARTAHALVMSMQRGDLCGLVHSRVFLDWMLVSLTHQYGFKPLFFHKNDGDVYFTILAAAQLRGAERRRASAQPRPSTQLQVMVCNSTYTALVQASADPRKG